MVIFIDMDGTICTEEKTFERFLAQPKPGAKEFIEKLVNEGHTVVIYTARGWNELKLTEHQLKSWGIPYNGIHMNKPVADIWIDDRAIRFIDWETLTIE